MKNRSYGIFLPLVAFLITGCQKPQVTAPTPTVVVAQSPSPTPTASQPATADPPNTPVDPSKLPGISPGFTLSQEDAYFKHIQAVHYKIRELKPNVELPSDISSNKAVAEQAQQMLVSNLVVPSEFIRLDTLMASMVSDFKVGYFDMEMGLQLKNESAFERGNARIDAAMTTHDEVVKEMRRIARRMEQHSEEWKAIAEGKSKTPQQ